MSKNRNRFFSQKKKYKNNNKSPTRIRFFLSWKQEFLLENGFVKKKKFKEKCQRKWMTDEKNEGKD